MFVNSFLTYLLGISFFNVVRNKSDNSETDRICLDFFGFKMEYIYLLDYTIAGKYLDIKIQTK